MKQPMPKERLYSSMETMKAMRMEHTDDMEIKSEIDNIAKRIRSIMETIKEFEPDPEDQEDVKKEASNSEN